MLDGEGIPQGKHFLSEKHNMISNRNIEQQVLSGFSTVTMRRVAILFFGLGVVKNSMRKFLMARQFMIMSLLKNCA